MTLEPLICDNTPSGPTLRSVEPVELLHSGWDLAVSVSGGKDSQAMLRHLVEWHKRENLSGQLIAVHADLGRAEWKITTQVVKQQCALLGVPLHIVKRNDGLDLVDIIDRRRLKLSDQEKPFWPSSAARYCTSDLKRAVIDVWVRNHWSSGNILMTMGMRADESPKRAKLPIVSLRPNCQSKNRTVIDWLPIHDWQETAVWNVIGYRMNELQTIRQKVAERRAAGADKKALIDELLRTFKAHPAYALGNSRLSCALCILADQHDLANGAEYNLELYQRYTRWEMESGYAFQQGNWLADLRPDLLEPDVRAWREAQQ